MYQPMIILTLVGYDLDVGLTSINTNFEQLYVSHEMRGKDFVFFFFIFFNERKYMPILMSMRLIFQLGYKLHVKLPSSNHLFYLL